MPRSHPGEGRPDAIDALADQNALHRDIRGRPGETVGRHLPAPIAEPVGKIVKGVAGIFACFDTPGHRRDTSGRIARAQQLEGTQLRDPLGQVSTGVIARLVDPPVPVATPADEVIVLGDDLPRPAGRS